MVPSRRLLRPDRVRLTVDLDSGGIPISASISAYTDGDLLGCHTYTPEPFDSLDDIVGQLHFSLARYGLQMTLF